MFDGTSKAVERKDSSMSRSGSDSTSTAENSPNSSPTTGVRSSLNPEVIDLLTALAKLRAPCEIDDPEQMFAEAAERDASKSPEPDTESEEGADPKS
jgi:hypothetical protein